MLEGPVTHTHTHTSTHSLPPTDPPTPWLPSASSLTAVTMGTEVTVGAIKGPVTPCAVAVVDHDVLLVAVAVVEVERLPLEAKEGTVLALPLLKGAQLVAGEGEHLDPVAQVLCPQTQLQRQAEQTPGRHPAEALRLGRRVTRRRRHRGRARHLHTLTVVTVIDEERAAVH